MTRIRQLVVAAKALIEVSLVKPVKDSVRTKFHKALAKILTEKGFPATYDSNFDYVYVEGAKKDGNVLNKALKAAGWALVEGINKNLYLYAKDKAFWPLEVNVSTGAVYLSGESFFDIDKLDAIIGKLKLPSGYSYTRNASENAQLDDRAVFTFDTSEVTAEGVKALARVVADKFTGGKSGKMISNKQAHEVTFTDGSYKYTVLGFVGDKTVDLTIRASYS